MARRPALPALRITFEHRLGHYASISVAEPVGDDAVVTMYETLVDEYGQAAGDAFLEACTQRAISRGMLTKSGRRPAGARRAS